MHESTTVNAPPVPPITDGDGVTRVHVAIRGAVQGVGFRPFVFRLAHEMTLTGWVGNTPQGVEIEAEGARRCLEAFLLRLEREQPPRASIQSLECSWRGPAGFTDFAIRSSNGTGQTTATVLPDIAVCAECLREVADPSNRRYRYPFTNCTNCGPRFSIIESLPYDRSNTTMKRFTMCDRCQAEYEDPRDRRFHAQPNACPECGPRLELWNVAGDILAARDDALLAAADAIRRGDIVAVKGLGGFHLMVDARNDEAVCRLRQRKHREEKPFALMYPSLEAVTSDCEVSALEARLLRSPESPIVLLSTRTSDMRHATCDGISKTVAPGNPYLGVMLPYTPLHHLLMTELRRPLVATSGNLSDEPICTDEHEALRRLHGIADLFLVHNRPIARHVDDSIARVSIGREMILRRARGYAPLPVLLQPSLPPLLAVGAHLKNSVAIAFDRQIVCSQHIGDLDTTQSFNAFRRAIGSLTTLYAHRPSATACDLHPDYRSTRFARHNGGRVIAVQHHHAHILSCMAEHHLDAPLLGVAWDGTGYGPDGTIWGGEFLRITEEGYERAAHLRTFRLPGGERAIREPRRAALGLLTEMMGEAVFERHDLAPIRACSKQELDVIRRMLTQGINAPSTSSTGRLFDAVASIVDLRQITRFEGQAAMELEYAADNVQTEDAYPVRMVARAQETESEPRTEQTAEQKSACGLHPPPPAPCPLVIDWAPMVLGILEDMRREVPRGVISAKFHNTLADCIVEAARRLGERRIVLTGGCFQNRRLTERSVGRLRESSLKPYWHQRVPPNDGGIAVGQLLGAWLALARS